MCINWVNRNVKGIKTCAMLSMGLPFTYRADAGWLPLPRAALPGEHRGGLPRFLLARNWALTVDGVHRTRSGLAS